MNKQRAQEIAVSPVMANVTYNGFQYIFKMWMKIMKMLESIPLMNPIMNKRFLLSNLIEH